MTAPSQLSRTAAPKGAAPDKRQLWTILLLAVFVAQVTNTALGLHLHQVSDNHYRHLYSTDCSTPPSPHAPPDSHKNNHRHDESHCPFCRLAFTVAGKYMTPPVDIAFDEHAICPAPTPRTSQPPRPVSKQPWWARPPPGAFHFLATF